MSNSVSQECGSNGEDKKVPPSYGPLDPDKMMRTAEVLYRTHWSRTTLWRRIRAGEYHKPILIGPNLNAWLGAWHLAWLKSRPQRSYGPD